ncbi:MAG TPA: hypothetical protein ENH75_10940 [archaeon]|nr:hypothetical protein [archaeon]
MNQRNMVTWMGSQGSSPVPGNLHAGFQEEGEMVTSPPYSTTNSHTSYKYKIKHFKDGDFNWHLK